MELTIYFANSSISTVDPFEDQLCFSHIFRLDSKTERHLSFKSKLCRALSELVADVRLLSPEGSGFPNMLEPR
jgi:hypothetical protein